MSLYSKYIRLMDSPIDVDFWKQPEGVVIPDDPLKFLYIPDQVEALMVADLARQIHAYQVDHAEAQITKAVMVTMGGLLPGVLLHDHLAWNPDPLLPPVEFGTMGVQYYAGPGQPLDSPRIVQDVTVDVEGKSVAVIEDLVDLGGTARFVAQYLRERGADDVVLVAPYLKNRRLFDEMSVITFGFVPPDTWIITPRERVETLIKRVPFWQEQGALYEDCVNNLREIGYPYYLIDLYLPMVYNE